MEPKNLANMLDPTGEAQREMQLLSSHQYYEAGMKALHESIKIKDATEAMIKEHLRTVDFMVMAIKWFGPVFLWAVMVQAILVVMTTVVRPWVQTAALVGIGGAVGMIGLWTGLRVAASRGSNGRRTGG